MNRLASLPRLNKRKNNFKVIKFIEWLRANKNKHSTATASFTATKQAISTSRHTETYHFFFVLHSPQYSPIDQPSTTSQSSFLQANICTEAVSSRTRLVRHIAIAMKNCIPFFFFFAYACVRYAKSFNYCVKRIRIFSSNVVLCCRNIYEWHIHIYGYIRKCVVVG